MVGNAALFATANSRCDPSNVGASFDRIILHFPSKGKGVQGPPITSVAILRMKAGDSTYFLQTQQVAFDFILFLQNLVALPRHFTV